MTKDELKTRLESAEKQMEGLKDEIENLKAKLNDVQDEEIPVFPVFDCFEDFWFMNTFLENSGCLKRSNPITTHYNYFHSSEYCDIFVKKCREIAMLLHCKWYCDRNGKENWSAGSNNYIVFYDHCHKHYGIGSWTYHDFGTVVFSNEKSAKKACAWMNAHAKRGDSNDNG